MSFFTPLRYPGGKARLGPWLAQVLAHNSLTGGHYAEPYAGGAGAAIFLLMRGFVEHVHINDADPAVHAFWHAALRNTTRFARMVRDTPVNMDTWEEQQDILTAPSRHSHLRLGFAAFFLNRTNRSGILSGGVIGGKAQAGQYSLEARFNKADLIERIFQLGAMASCITISCRDAKDWLTDNELPKKSLLYLDPPYYVKGSLLYRNFYEPEDHAAIAQLVMKRTTPVIVTYDDVPPIRDLYATAARSTFSLHYSTHDSRRVSTEVLFYRNLQLPSPPRLTRGDELSPARAHKVSDVVPHRVDELLC